MAKHTTLSSLFTDIANAIRSKTDSTEAIIADDFPTEIANLRTGFDYNNHNITSISDYEFKNCDDLKSVDCYNLISIGAGAFENCTNLKSIVLYDGVENIGENAFKGCNCIICCMFDSQPEEWHENWNPDNCEVVWLGGAIETWDISATEADSVEAKLYKDIKNEGYSLVITGSGDMKNYISLRYVPWYNYYKNITSITIPNGITSIGECAFIGCSSLTSIIIPNSVTTIGIDAFSNCSSLTSIIIPNSITSIGNSVFSGCSSLTSIIIPNSVTSIDDYAFFYCKSLTSIIIPDSITNIGRDAFGYCDSLTSITIPDSVTEIGSSAFNNCTALTSITIPGSVTSIENYVFRDCSSLTFITIPDIVTSIGVHALQNCSSLVSITYTGTTAQWNAIDFNYSWNDSTSNYTIHCTDGDIAKNGTITYYYPEGGAQ